MSNTELQAIWKEIEAIAKSDREYINSLPDEQKLNNEMIANYDRFLADHIVIANVL